MWALHHASRPPTYKNIPANFLEERAKPQKAQHDLKYKKELTFPFSDAPPFDSNNCEANDYHNHHKYEYRGFS